MSKRKVKEYTSTESALPLGIGPTHKKTVVKDDKGNRGVGYGHDEHESSKNAHRNYREDRSSNE